MNHYFFRKECNTLNTINVTRSSMPSYEEYCEEIKELWDSHWLTNMGYKHKQLEADLKEYLHTPNITLYVNGHLALENMLVALSLPKDSEVITTPFTFASTTHAIVRNGFVPVFCDVNSSDYTIDVTKIESLITDKTSAILPVHVYGNMCDVVEIQRIADKHHLKVVYDAAHAFGVTFKGISSANFGDASMFSFHATKVFNTIEGGALCYHDSGYIQRLSDLKNFGIRNAEEVAYIGGNAKMNEFVAAMGICNLRHLDNEIAKRKAVVEHYITRLSGIDGIILCKPQQNVTSNFAYFPVIFDGYKYSRDEMFNHLNTEGIIARKYFYPLTNSFVCYKGMNGFNPDFTPVAKHIAAHVLTLPLYADLAIEDVERICKIILK